MESKSILLVDDEIQILNSLKRFLSNRGYEIIVSTSPLEAIELLKKRPINIIVSDYRMPKMTGAEFLREARQLRPETVRLVLSGYADAQVVTEMIEKGEIFRFLMKPWEQKEIIDVIEEGFNHQERLAFLSAS